jgi:hypothetical protein
MYFKGLEIALSSRYYAASMDWTGSDGKSTHAANDSDVDKPILPTQFFTVFVHLYRNVNNAEGIWV